MFSCFRFFQVFYLLQDDQRLHMMMNIFSEGIVISIGMIVLVGHMIGCSEQMIGTILAAVVLLRFLLCMLLPSAVIFYWKCWC